MLTIRVPLDPDRHEDPCWKLDSTISAQSTKLHEWIWVPLNSDCCSFGFVAWKRSAQVNRKENMTPTNCLGFMINLPQGLDVYHSICCCPQLNLHKRFLGWLAFQSLCPKCWKMRNCVGCFTLASRHKWICLNDSMPFAAPKSSKDAYNRFLKVCLCASLVWAWLDWHTSQPWTTWPYGGY